MAAMFSPPTEPTAPPNSQRQWRVDANDPEASDVRTLTPWLWSVIDAGRSPRPSRVSEIQGQRTPTRPPKPAVAMDGESPNTAMAPPPTSTRGRVEAGAGGGGGGGRGGAGRAGGGSGGAG